MVEIARTAIMTLVRISWSFGSFDGFSRQMCRFVMSCSKLPVIWELGQRQSG